ncbi:MAG: DUF5111 domain-containing protein [Bacteroidales bacterium]|nr:DUF5111 domain-containing protein [Bacteroidales bacterium]
MKQYISLLTALAIAAAGFSACDDDLDEYKVSGLSQSTMDLESANTVTISTSNLSKVVLQMTFTADGHDLYITNDYDAQTALGEGAYSLQVSSASDFASNTTTVPLADPIKGLNDVTYTGQALNILASSLGLEAGKEGKLYFRIAHSYTSDNIQGATFSSPVEVTVVPLFIDMSRAFILDKDKTAAIDTLYSPSSNGIYEGFIGTYGGWFNFWVEDGMSQVWGNYGADGNFARADLASNGAWNFWTAEPAGCIYLSLNTNAGSQYITYTNLSTLSLKGGASADLNFDAASVTWTGSFTTTNANAQITLSGVTKANDNGTGDAATSGRDGTMDFSANADGSLSIGGNSPIEVATPGTYKIVVDLSSATLSYKISSMGDTKVYPSYVTAKAGEVEVKVDSEIEGGLATGLYVGKIENATAGATLSFTDSNGNAVGGTATLDNASTYSFTLNLATNELTVNEILYTVAETLGLYYDENYEWIQATMYSGYTDEGELNGIYSGLFYKSAEDWKFFAKDGNGVYFGVNDTWDQFSFIKDSKANFWVTATQATYLYTFDVNNATWSETVIEKIALTGDFTKGEGQDGWDLDEKFTDNGDGTWTLSDVNLIDEQWGPYLVLNGDWDLKLYIAADGTSLTTVNTGNFFATQGAGTYDITINALTNSVTITKK